eukprot:jgi/Ulvmu1/5917/UM026_0039.1
MQKQSCTTAAGDCISMASESAMHFLLPKQSHPFKPSSDGAGTPVMSDSSHPPVNAAAVAADAPSSRPTSGSRARSVLPDRTGTTVICTPVGVSPAQAALHITDPTAASQMWAIDGESAEGGLQGDVIMADAPAVANEHEAGLQRLALPILSDPTALPFGDAVHGVGNSSHTIAPH